MHKIFLCIFLFTNIEIVYLQRDRNRNPTCHLRVIDECIQPLFYFSHRPNTTGLVVGRKDHAILCKSLKNLANCLGDYLNRCGTPLYQEIFGIAIEVYINTIRQLCINGPIKQNYLNHASCLNNKVKSSTEYRRKCVNRFQATLESISPIQDDRIGAACCAYKWWLDCSLGMVSDNCSPPNDAAAAYYDYTNILSAGIPEQLCKSRRYSITSRFCKRVLTSPRKRAKGRNSDSIISKNRGKKRKQR